MTETPREYKKRIDEKRVRNGKNKWKLIEKIEWYELLDEKFKSKTKQEILENFSKNEKADKESEQYKIIVSELENVDKKYEELGRLKTILLSKKNEILEVEKAIRESKLDGEDETTLKMQMAKVRKLKEKLKTLKSEVEELEKEIENREQEIKEIEGTYGEMVQVANTEDNNRPVANEEGTSSDENVVPQKLKILKEFRKTTMKDLWKKNRTRWEIIQLLEDWTWIDDELKKRIEKEISDRFLCYYDEKQWSLRMKSARFMKNKLRDVKKKYKKAVEDDDSELPYVVEELAKLEKIYWSDEVWENEWNKILESSRKKLQENYSSRAIEHLTWLVEIIPVKTRIEYDGSRLIEFKLNWKKYKILDINLSKHSDPEYQGSCYSWFGQGELKSWIRTRNIDERKDEKLKQYVKKKQLEWFIIPSKDVIEKLFRELWDISDYCQWHRIFMYLVGIYWECWIDKIDSDGDRRYVGRDWGSSDNFDYRWQDKARGLFMIASEDDS